ncbi:hypothetical protein C0992_007632 [Termitomyces sp. T32_za158]|nr:hypothetical protein C0992_007632 [Termitomyces sp. T32_za158]
MFQILECQFRPPPSRAELRSYCQRSHLATKYLSHNRYRYHSPRREAQFCDPKLRRFNLIGVDTRLHGDTEGKVKGVFGSEDAAHDMAAFMDALQLPPCHFFGLSMGTRIALQMGITYPEKVLSLFLVSPIPIEEPAEVREGRQEIYEYWCQGWRDPARPDIEAIKDSAKGSNQLGFNSTSGPLIKAMRKEEIMQRLINAGVDAEIKVVEDAPHFGSVTNAAE